MTIVVVYRCPACDSELKVTTGYLSSNRYVCRIGHFARTMREVSTGTDCGGYLLKVVPAQENRK